MASGYMGDKTGCWRLSHGLDARQVLLVWEVEQADLEQRRAHEKAELIMRQYFDLQQNRCSLPRTGSLLKVCV